MITGEAEACSVGAEVHMYVHGHGGLQTVQQIKIVQSQRSQRHGSNREIDDLG